MKNILILISFLTLIIAAPFGFIFEMLAAGFYWGQTAARNIGKECQKK